MLQHKISLILFLICYGRFGFAKPDDGIRHDASKAKCTHGGILNGVFLHGGLKSRNDTIFTNVPSMQACINKCCKVDKCDLAMMTGKVCHAVKCQDEDSCQIMHSKGGSSLKAQIAFITKGEEVKEETKLEKTKEPISTSRNSRYKQQNSQNKIFHDNQSEAIKALKSGDEDRSGLRAGSGKAFGESTTTDDVDSASGSGESGDEQETSESGLKSIQFTDYSRSTQKSSGDQSSQSSGDDNSGSGQSINIDRQPNSRQPEFDFLPKPSSGRSGIPTPRNTKFIHLSDSSPLFQNDDKSYMALTEKNDDADDDYEIGSGSGAKELTDASGDEDKENLRGQKEEHIGSFSKYEKKVVERTRRPLTKPIKAPISPELVLRPQSTNKVKKGKEKAPKSSTNNLLFANDNSDKHGDFSSKHSKASVKSFSEKPKRLKTAAKEQKSKEEPRKKLDNHKENIKKDTKVFASLKRRRRPLQDLGSQGDATDLISFAPINKLNSKITEKSVAQNNAAKDFNSIARGKITEKPSSNSQKNSLAFMDRQKLNSKQKNIDSNKRKTITHLQYQLSNLLAKNSRHVVSPENAQKLSILPDDRNAKKRKLIEKIRRIQRERERERHYTQAINKQTKDSADPLYELLRPQDDYKCRRGVTIRGATLKGGMLAGDFQTIGIVNNQQTCIKSCCGNRRCDVALMLGKECFNVKCYSENLCDLAPATTLFDEVTPVITYVRGHVTKRSIDYDDFDEESIIENVRKQDAELIQRLEYLTE